MGFGEGLGRVRESSTGDSFENLRGGPSLLFYKLSVLMSILVVMSGVISDYLSCPVRNGQPSSIAKYSGVAYIVFKERATVNDLRAPSY